MTRLLEALKLPLDPRGQRRAAARAEWFAAMAQPLEMHDLIER
jgi:chromosome partitioning protein